MTRPAALANSVNVFNVVPSTSRLLAGGLKLRFSKIGARGVTSVNDVDHPFGTRRSTLVRRVIGRKCTLFAGHYTRKQGVPLRRLYGVTRNHM